MTAIQQVAQLLEEAEHFSTVLGEGVLCWQQWSGPQGSRPLLLLHGGFGSWTHWVANIRQLRQTRTVWTLDMPGLGSSADMADPFTVEHFSRVILDSLDTLHGKACEFDLAGFSFGALIGSHVAAAAQNRCHHFIACGAAGFGDLHVQVDLLRPPGAEVAMEEAEAIHRANLRTLMFSRDETVDGLAVHVHAAYLAQARFNSRRLARGRDFITAIPAIKARLCGIWGSEDATAGGRAAIEARKDLFRRSQANCSFHILEGIGHWAMYEDARVFNRIVENVCSNTSGI